MIAESARGTNDYALVLAVVGEGSGVSGSGAESRARAFVDWLIAPSGGGLPGNHVHALLGRDHDIGAASLRQMLYELIPDLDDRLESGGTAGRRCYVYLAGPAIQLPNEIRLVAKDKAKRPRVLDASFQRFAGYLRATRVFDEVVGFADVLLDSALDPRGTPQDPVSPSSEPVSRGGPAAAFAAISAPTKAPRTKKLPARTPTTDLVSYLGFTGAIIEGLTNAARDTTGAITAESLVTWAGPRLRSWLGPSGQMPRYEYTTTPPFVFFEAPAAQRTTSAPARMPNAHALCIGIDDYVTIARLTGCADDARALASALESPNGGGYDSANVRTLTDRDATRDAVIGAFSELASACDGDSTVFIWFSGRAFVDESGATRIFLADDQVAAPLRGLTAAQLNAMLDALPARRIVVVIDTSGGCAGLTPRPGRILLSATLPEEPGYSGSNRTPGGDFTNAILRALGGGAATSGDDISVFDVFEYAHPEVVKLGKQHPTIGMVWGEIGFPIAKRPLAPSVPSTVDPDGYVYDVHVVHSLTSPRAGFVESVVLPALRDAGLRVAVSAPLETSPVGRVVQIQRGLTRARRTLLLDGRASSGDADFDDVVRLALAGPSPLVDPRRLVVVALESGGTPSGRREASVSDGSPVVVETEPFDLVSAQTSHHPSIQKLVERLKASLDPTIQAVSEAEPNVPVVEVTEEAETPARGVILTGEDSTRVLQLTLSKTEKRAEVTTTLRKGNIVFLCDPNDDGKIVGVSRVVRAFRPARMVPTAGRARRYDFDLPVRLPSPVASTPETVSPSAAAFAVATSAVRNSDTAQRESLLSLVMALLSAQRLTDLLRFARSTFDPVDRGNALRAVAYHARQTLPDALPVLETLRGDGEPSIRALAKPTDLQVPFANACFFDATLERNRVVKIGGTLGIQLQRWRSEPLYVHERGLTSFEQAVGVMRQSASIVLVWSKEMANDEWFALMREAIAIDDERVARFSRTVQPRIPSTIVTLTMDAPNDLPAELMTRRWIDATGLASASDEAMIARVTSLLLDAVLSATQLALENPPPALSRISRPEAIGRISIERGDLLESDADAIVNAVGASATESGEIGRQLMGRLGDSMVATLERHESLVAGETRLTVTGERIPARYVIHTCTEDSPRGHSVESVVVGALGALRAAEALPTVRRVAFPALGSGVSALDPGDIARAVLPSIVDRLTTGSPVTEVRFVLHGDEATSAYGAVLDELQSPAIVTTDSGEAVTITSATVVNATRWYVSARQSSVGSVYVGALVPVGIFFSTEPAPNAVPIDLPFSAFELTVYVDATAAFHLEGSSQQTVQLRDGHIDRPSLPLRLLALASGTHTVRITVNTRGALTAATDATIACPISVEAPVLLPNIPELIDRRTIPSPQPDIVLYVATEPTSRNEQLRIHLTCPALGLDRRRLEDALPLNVEATAAIRIAAADVANGLDGSAPPDARAALLAFGAALYDVLAPPGHELRTVFARLLRLTPPSNRPLSWLVVSDEAASLPWELVCPHGYGTDGTHWYDEPLATRFAIAHWISRRGFDMPNEAPIGPLGIVHYGQHAEAYARWRDAIGADLASEADRRLGLDILKRGSPYFGVHLLRFTNPDETGRIAEADTSHEHDARDSLGGERRLDFTLRRPIVSLSLVDTLLDRGAQAVRRYTNIEPAWVAPFLLARASAVVGPRWTTSPSSDRAFFRTFYDAVRADRPLGVAVWEAREALRLAHPERADWLAYAYFGHPSCEPYPVETAEGFTLFEPMGMVADEPFTAGRDYLFRASFRGELPAWYNGRRHLRTTRLRGEGVKVLIAALHGGDPVSVELIPASGNDAGGDDDFYMPVMLSMPSDAGTYKWFIQFTRGDAELRSSVITIDVVESPSDREARLVREHRELVKDA